MASSDVDLEKRLEGQELSRRDELGIRMLYPDPSDPVKADADCFKFYAEILEELEKDLKSGSITSSEFAQLERDAWEDLQSCRETVEEDRKMFEDT